MDSLGYLDQWESCYLLFRRLRVICTSADFVSLLFTVPSIMVMANQVENSHSCTTFKQLGMTMGDFFCALFFRGAICFYDWDRWVSTCFSVPQKLKGLDIPVDLRDRLEPYKLLLSNGLGGASRETCMLRPAD